MKHSIIRISLLSLVFVFFLYSCQMEGEDKEKKEKAQQEATKEKADLKPDEVMLTKKQFDMMKIELDNPVQKNLNNIFQHVLHILDLIKLISKIKVVLFKIA